MKRFSALHVPLLSFFSKSLYQDVAWNWKGTCLLYLLVLLAVCWVPLMVKFQATLSRFVTREAPPIVEQIPPITIRDGEVSVDVEQPYTIKDPKTGGPAAIIDTTGSITSLEGQEARVLLTKTRLIIAERRGKTTIHDLSAVSSFHINQALILWWLRWARSWLVVIVYPLALLFTYIYRLLQALFYAVIGMLFAGLVRVKLSFQALIRLAIVATTPAILLNTIVEAAGFRIPWWWLICFAIAMAYLYFGLRASASTVDAEIVGPPGVPTFAAE